MLGSIAIVCKSHVSERDIRHSRIQSTTGHEKPDGKPGGPPPKPKYYLMTDSEKYSDGKLKRTPGGE